MLRTFAEGVRSRDEGTVPKVPMSARRGQASADGLAKAFTALRQEFVSLGYAVPPEVALQRTHRSDM
jgi:hypothetical protein